MSRTRGWKFSKRIVDRFRAEDRVSVAAAWCFPDEQADAAEQVLDDLPRVGGVVPATFRYEIRNVLMPSQPDGSRCPGANPGLRGSAVER